MGLTTILLIPLTTLHHGHFDVKTRGNAVTIVKVFKNELWTELRTTFRLKCRIFKSQNFSDDSPAAGGASQAHTVLGRRHQFPLGSPAFPVFLVSETNTDSPVYLVVYA